MSQIEFVHASYASDAAADRPLPYRQAVPLLFVVSLALWVVVWQAGAAAVRLMFG